MRDPRCHCSSWQVGGDLAGRGQPQFDENHECEADLSVSPCSVGSFLQQTNPGWTKNCISMVFPNILHNEGLGNTIYMYLSGTFWINILFGPETTFLSNLEHEKMSDSL